MRFEFATATRILFGPETLHEVPAAARAWGSRALVVTGRRTTRAEPLGQLLTEAGVTPVTLPVTGEPTLDDVRRGSGLARSEQSELVIGMGGGSAIDAAKAIAVLATNAGDPLDYLEVVGRGQALEQPALPLIAIPTTAGTGAEVTRNAVLASPAHRVKASLRSQLLLPRLAVIDPTLTLALPPDRTATTGLDALTQLIEAFVSCRASPMTDGFCREGILRAARSLRRVFAKPGDLEARCDMALASLFSGLALANAGLGAVHGFAAVIGGMFSAPHGAICAALLPSVMETNLQALRKRQPAGEALKRFAAIGQWLLGGEATAEDGVRWVADLCRDFEIPRLGTHGLNEGDLAEVCEKAATASSMKGNPLPLEPDELNEALRRAI